MVVLVQLAERQIVALEVKGSTPLDHPIKTFQIVGCRQVVRHWILIPTLRRFESYHPSHNRGHEEENIIGVSPSGKAQDFDSCIRRFKSCHPSQTKTYIVFIRKQFLSLNKYKFLFNYFGLLAQPVEHLPFNQGVPGSNPG